MGGLADGRKPLTQPSSFLPWPAEAIITSVGRFGMFTSSQIRRLHYLDGTVTGKGIRSRRHLKRLTDLGLLKRIWGIYDGPPEYIYLPPSSKARRADMHTLDINELYVRLAEPQTVRSDYKSLIFDPEPWCHVQIGHLVLKPDFYLDLGKMRYFGELDRGTEFRSVLAQKMRRYVVAFEKWEEPTFPLVLWVCHDSDRKRFIESVIARQSEPRLFVCCLFNEVVNAIDPRTVPFGIMES